MIEANTLKKLFKRLVAKVLRWLNQTITLVLIPDSYQRTLTIRFKPLWPLLFLATLAILSARSFALVSTAAHDKITTASLASELETSRSELRDVHGEVDNMVQLMDRLQNTLGALGKGQSTGKDESLQSPDQDFMDITASAGLISNSKMSDIERLRMLNAFIEDTMSPLKESLSLLANERRLLSELPTVWPVKGHSGHISFLFGPNLDPISRNRWYLHRGLDIAGVPGTPLVAAADGKVVEVDYNANGYGNYVIIKHKYGIYTLYAHQQRVYVSVGDLVSQGQTIGLMGASGRVTGPHLHFEIRIGTQIVDPLVYLRMAEINRTTIDRYLAQRQSRRSVVSRSGDLPSGIYPVGGSPSLKQIP